MKRIVIRIDGTWNKEGITGNTNVAALDPGNRVVAHAFIKAAATDGIAQHVHYHDGVGAEGDLFKRLLGGAIGLSRYIIADRPLTEAEWIAARADVIDVTPEKDDQQS